MNGKKHAASMAGRKLRGEEKVSGVGQMKAVCSV